jgi:hypothetical protein
MPVFPVVDRNRRRLVPRNRNDVEDAAAKIQRHLLVRPARDTEERLHVFRFLPDHRRVRLPFELGIASGVIVMGVRVRHEQAHAGLPVSLRPVVDDLLNRLAYWKGDAGIRSRRSAGVLHEDDVVAEQQVDERTFVVDALVFAKDERVFRKGVHLKRGVRVRRARIAAVNPSHVQVL